MFEVYEVSREALRALRPILSLVQEHDRDLYRQMRRAGAAATH